MASHVASVLSKSAIAAGFGGAVSYFLLGRKDVLDLFGMELNHALGDAVLIGISSTTGTVASIYALPAIERRLVPNSTALMILTHSLNPVFTGSLHLLAKKYLVSPPSRDAWKEFLLGAASDLTADKLVTTYMGKM